MKLDKIDFTILEMLIKDARTSFREIARKLQVSPDTISKRFEKLKKEGFHRDAIEGFSSPGADFYVITRDTIMKMYKEGSIIGRQYFILFALYQKAISGIIPFVVHPTAYGSIHHDIQKTFGALGFNPYSISIVSTGRTKALLLKYYNHLKRQMLGPRVPRPRVPKPVRRRVNW